MYCMALLKLSSHQELAQIVRRVVEIGLRGGAWAELQNDTSLQSPRIQSNFVSPSVPYSNAERTRTEPLPYSAGTVSSSKDT